MMPKKKEKIIGIVAAHPDDEVLGCGGTISRLANEGHQVHILLLADGESSRGTSERSIKSKQLSERKSAAKRACKILNCTSVDLLSLPDNRLDRFERLDIIKKIEEFIEHYRPNMVFTHHIGDVNIDHRIVHDAVIAACRSRPGHPVRELLFFEVLSSTEWRPPSSGCVFHPNVFVDISSTISRKLDALRAYESELRDFPHPRSIEAVEALARWRGATVGVNAAEAFILGRKVI